MEAKQKIDLVERYVAAYNARDLDAILALYAPEATMEDPVGSPPQKGGEAISALYRTGFEMGVRLELEGRVRCAGDSAVFPLRARTEKSVLYVIDLFEFDAAGKVKRMRAYWGPENLVGEMDLKIPTR